MSSRPGLLWHSTTPNTPLFGEKYLLHMEFVIWTIFTLRGTHGRLMSNVLDRPAMAAKSAVVLDTGSHGVSFARWRGLGCLGGPI